MFDHCQRAFQQLLLLVKISIYSISAREKYRNKVGFNVFTRQLQWWQSTSTLLLACFNSSRIIETAICLHLSRQFFRNWLDDQGTFFFQQNGTWKFARDNLFYNLNEVEANLSQSNLKQACSRVLSSQTKQGKSWNCHENEKVIASRRRGHKFTLEKNLDINFLTFS